jgi:hypothetical protein
MLERLDNRQPLYSEDNSAGFADFFAKMNGQGLSKSAAAEQNAHGGTEGRPAQAGLRHHPAPNFCHKGWRVITDRLFERILIDHNIFPLSVLDSRYGDNAAMTKRQVIEKTLVEMSRYWSWLTGCELSDGAGYLGIVAAELDVKLPDCVIKTCGSFQHLNASCCDKCHTYYPHRQMSLVDLPDGGKAWVCHEIERAIFPERHKESHEPVVS